VNIHDAIAFVTFGDAGGGQIASEDARQTRWDFRQRRSGWKSRRHRPSAPAGGFLQIGESLVQPAGQLGR
jgi:hypothetical protein